MGKILRKRTERLQARQKNYAAHPPKRANYAQTNLAGAQDHGTNRQGGMLKFPGSMK